MIYIPSLSSSSLDLRPFSLWCHYRHSAETCSSVNRNSAKSDEAGTVEALCDLVLQITPSLRNCTKHRKCDPHLSVVWSQNKEEVNFEVNFAYSDRDIYLILPFQSEILHFRHVEEMWATEFTSIQHALCSSLSPWAAENWRLIFAASSKTQTGWHNSAFSWRPKRHFYWEWHLITESAAIAVTFYSCHSSVRQCDSSLFCGTLKQNRSETNSWLPTHTEIIKLIDIMNNLIDYTQLQIQPAGLLMFIQLTTHCKGWSK